MTQPTDDLDAVRIIVEALSAFQKDDQERIIRWALEKSGLNTKIIQDERDDASSTGTSSSGTDANQVTKVKNIRDFVRMKSPQTDTQLAATVAYYYQFEAPEQEKKQVISKDDLQNATRLADIDRLTKPAQTLVNAHHSGVLDKGSEKGTYSINSVGENLVAMTLPAPSSVKKFTKRPASKKAAKKNARESTSKRAKK